MGDSNTDFKRRSKIMGHDTSGAYHSFEGMKVDTLRNLIVEQFADPEDQQNDAPNIAKIYKFLEAHPDFTAHGYTIGGDRSDHRVSIEGIAFRGRYGNTVVEDFVCFAQHADELTVEDRYLRCWWD